MPVVTTSAPPAASRSIATSIAVTRAAPRSPARERETFSTPFFIFSFTSHFFRRPQRRRRTSPSSASLLQKAVAQRRLRLELHARGRLVAGRARRAERGQRDGDGYPDLDGLVGRDDPAGGVEELELERVNAVGELGDLFGVDVL